MPDEKPISGMTTAPDVTEDSLLEVAVVDQSAETGFSTDKCALGFIVDKILRAVAFTQRLNTTNKTVFGAINEIAQSAGGGVTVTGTLTAGSTSITLQNAAITSSSTLDFYTDVFGVNPTNAVVSNGSVTLTFEAQAADLGVKVRVS